MNTAFPDPAYRVVTAVNHTGPATMKTTNRFIVSSGSYQIGKAQDQALDAYLGTCVGVTIADPVARAGGLIHLLLPEPVSNDSEIDPEKYASTGIPMFLEDLRGLGASNHRMFATIAGGALIGPLSMMDLSLNIGGRTSEKVREILDSEGIRIDRSETGGLFSCKLSLDMQDFTSSIEPAGMDKLTTEKEPGLPSPGEISEALDLIQPIPQVALKLLRIMNEPDYNLTEIIREVRKDQVIGARVLRLCNSAFVSARKSISSLDHAVMFLGRDLLAKSVISACINQFFQQIGGGYSLCMGGIYHHAVGTAIVAEKVAQMTNRVPPTLAYTAGLLHDIGKVVLDQFIATGYPLFYRDMMDEVEVVASEKDKLGIDHTLAGSRLAEKWGLPEVIADTIRFHHTPENARIDPDLSHIVHIADLLMSRFNAGLELEYHSTEHLESRMAAVGLGLDNLAQIVDQLPRTVFSSSPDLFAEAS